MAATPTGIPFLDDLRENWQRGQFSRDEALNKLSLWEDDIVNRTDDELDAAWTFRQEIEGSTGTKGMSVPEMETLLAADIVRHIDSVLSALQDLAAADRLGDEYVPIIRTILAEGGPRYRDQVRALLESTPTRGPAARALLTEVAEGRRSAASSGNGAGEGETLREIFGDEGGAASAAPPADGGNGAAAPPGAGNNTASYTSTHSAADPWVAAQQHIALGRWDQARAALAQIPQSHPRFSEVPLLLRTIADDEIYDQIPGLREMLGQFASSRSRRDWKEFSTRRDQAERLVKDASDRSGRTFATPRSLVEIFDEATKAQDAERLVAAAIQDRLKGEFAEAGVRLNEAARLDPRYTRVQIEQQRNADLEQMLFDLRRNALSTADELVIGRALAEQLLEPDAAPGSNVTQSFRDRIQTRTERMIDSARRSIDGLQRGIQDPSNLEDKLRSCDLMEAKIKDIELLNKDEPDLPDLRDRVDRTRRQLELLKTQRDTLVTEIGKLDPQAMDVAQTAGAVHGVEVLVTDRLAKDDRAFDGAIQDLATRLNGFLSRRLQSNMPLDLASLEDCAEVLRLAQIGPRPLSAAQVAMYSRALWKAGADLVRAQLSRNKTLPPFQPGQPPRSTGIIDAWDQAQRVLDWLRGLTALSSEQTTLDALDHDFAQSVQSTLADTGNLPPRMSAEEAQERVITAQALQQRARTLPPTVQALLPLPLLTSPRTPAEQAIRQRQTISALLRVAGAAIVLLLFGGIAAAAWPAVDVGLIHRPTVTPVPTGTPVPTVTPVPPSPTPIYTPTPDISYVLKPEAAKPGCTFTGGFNICNDGDAAFKDFYAAPGPALLGAPLTQAFDDWLFQRRIQYFQFGILERLPDSNAGRRTDIHLGEELLGLSQVPASASERPVYAPGSGWEPVSDPSFKHWIRPDHRFLDLYLTNPEDQNPWKLTGGQRQDQFADALTFYGYPITEEYQTQIDGKPVTLQFFQRAVFQANADGSVIRWPVGAMYLNRVRHLPVPIPTITPSGKFGPQH